jgi:hypothetical protein
MTRGIGSAAIALLTTALIARFAMPSKADASHIEGVVTSQNGAEVGVWVIAETTDLPTRHIKIVVTGDQGRYVLPELPPANYKVWVRGYGLLDSEPVVTRPGRKQDLTAVVATKPAEAAKVYPANYWYSLIRPPSAGEFPGTGPSGNGISANLRVQGQWIDIQKQGCMVCHQLGSPLTRNQDGASGEMDSAIAWWDQRLQMGQRGPEMSRRADRFGRERGLRMFADWSTRIAQGELPPVPPRPAGIERNLVLSMWEWGTPIDYIHDQVTTDKRNPHINAKGRVYGTNLSGDRLTILDPQTHTATSLPIPVRTPPATPMIGAEMAVPSRFYGTQVLWNNLSNPHNPMMDASGRVWLTTAIRRAQPAWCHEGDNRFAKYFPLHESDRQVAYFDPKTNKFMLIDTCFGTHHPRFAEDENNTLYFSAEGVAAIGWINTRKYDETHDERASQGWCPLVIDTNGDGRITKPWNPPPGADKSRYDSKLDTLTTMGSYGIVPDSIDRSAVWFAWQPFPGRIARLSIGDHPPESCVTEVYEVPSTLDPAVTKAKTGFGPRGVDIDRSGIVWTALSGSGHFARFDRSKCKVTRGPSVVDGRHCAEGWELFPSPGPTLPDTDPPVRADYHAHNWVDQWNTLGLGQNVPIANGSNSDSLLALLPRTHEWVVLRVPYPQGFFTRGLDGRIDDPRSGWRGRAVWSTYSPAATWHIEGGKGVKPFLVKFQMRPNPLAGE